MTEKGRDLMVRDKFIASQRSCNLRRHLDGAAPETSILDITESCRVWESHGEPADIEDRSHNLSWRQQILPIPARTISKSKSGVGNLRPATIGLPRRTDHNMADRELLIRTVLEVVRECRETDMNDEGDRGQCFSCGFLGHGVNRCTWLDRSFPYITPGLSVNLRDGEYRASKLTGEVHIPTREKEGWFGREGQPPGPSVTITRLTQLGVVFRLGNDRDKTLMDPDGPRMCRASQFWGALLRRKRTAAIVQYRSVQLWWIKMHNWTRSVVQRGGGSHQAPLGPLTKAPRRQMRPAGNGGLTRRMTSARRNNTGMRSAARHISAEMVDFSPALAQARNEEARRKTKSSRTGGIGLTAVVKPALPTAGGGGGGV